MKPDPVDNRRKIYGFVRDQFQRPMTGIVINAFDKDIRNEETLGTTKTSEQGYYEIYYVQQQFARTDKDAADVVVRAMDPNGSVLKSSDIYYNAPALLLVNIDLGQSAFSGPSEFEQLVASVTPFLGELPLGDLTESAKTQDITFLSNKTSTDGDLIEKLAMAFRFTKMTRIPAYVFYGLLRKNIPSDAGSRVVANIAGASFETRTLQRFMGIMQEEIETLMKALEQAYEDNFISTSVAAELPAIRKALEAQIAAYKKDHPDASNDPAVLVQKISLAEFDAEQAIKFVNIFGKYEEKDGDGLKPVKDPSISHEENVDPSEALLSLGKITGEHSALMSALIQTENIRVKDDVGQLAGYSETDWIKYLKEKNLGVPDDTPGKGSDEKIKNYAGILEKKFSTAFPTTAFAKKLQQKALTSVEHSDQLADFLVSNRDFDLRSTRVNEFLNKQKKSKLSDDTKSTFGKSLKTVQRIFKLAPSYEGTEALLNKGIHSARQVYAMGKERFAKAIGESIDSQTANQIYNRAAKTHAAAIAIAGNLQALSAASKLNAMPDYEKMMLASPMAKEIPDLDELFQHADFCECEECRSVYGAASYLTDALHFLSQRMTDTTGTVRDRILERRPDMGNIDLTCENTNTLVPYIDIVCEVLEDFITPPVFSIANGFLANLPTAKGETIDAALLAELVLHTADLPHIDVLLTGEATVSAPYQPMGTVANSWIVRDKLITLLLTDNTADIGVLLLHQTHLSADEISANPEYTNVKTYTKLSGEKRPFGLPFDLFSTEGAIYLQKLGINKSDLIRIFSQEHQAPATPPTAELEEAYAFLNINFAERSLIFTPDTLNPATYWGTLAASANVQVDLFLNYTGLEYADIETLIRLAFINPLADTKIDHDDLSCDLNKQHLTNIDGPKFDALHRLLRMWRKTSFSLKELDACIQCTAIGNKLLDESFAWQLHHFRQVMDKLSLETYPLLAFYEDISAQGEDALYLQLFQNRAITNPLNPDFDLANIGAGITLTDQHLSVVQSAIGISIDDIRAIVTEETDGKLTLQNLSIIYRHALLLQSIFSSAAELLLAKELIPFDPFASPVQTMVFLIKIDMLNNAGISLYELNYLLRHQDDPANTLIPSTAIVTSNLGELQDALLQVNTATSVVIDPTGDLLNKWILDPLLKWDPAVSAKLMNMLRTVDDDDFQTIIEANYSFLKDLRILYDQPFHEVDLSELSPIETLASISANLIYDDLTKKLKFTGVMTPGEQTALLDAFTDQDYQDAVNKIFADSQGNPTSDADLDALPVLTSHAAVSGQLVFDLNRRKLRFNGFLDAALRDTLKDFYNNPHPVRTALDQLFNTQQTDNGAGNIFFATNGDVDTDLKSIDFAHIADRFSFFLGKISPVYRDIQQKTAIQNRISTWFSLDKTVAQEILIGIPSVYTNWTATAFVQKQQELNPVNYPAAFNSYLALAKIGLIVTRLRIDAAALDWLLQHAADVNTTDLLALPLVLVNTPVSAADFEKLENLVTLVNLHHSYAQTAPVSISIFTVLQDVLDGAVIADIETGFSQLYAWDLAQLISLIEPPDNFLNLVLAPPANSDLKNVQIIFKLYKCFATMELLDASAKDCVAWSQPVLSFDDTARIKQTLKSHYSDDNWLDVATPLQDKLRETKRDALVTYLLANPGTNIWEDSSDLYSYFLLDVEMSSCQPTSRIVQATNSVQQFVQRCFLGMEDDITVNADDPDEPSFDSKWQQWQWMKNYRVWEANRKVFLYPENWVEPELLPLKSTFFKELENDLLQNEVTRVNVEDAFMSYLEKLDGVARLEIKGMWYQDDNETLHVIGRTYGGDPHIYYYRQYIENRRWTPWEKIDLDINSDHIIPIAFNQRIYLFWAVFTDKALEPPDTQAVPDLKQTNFAVRKPDKQWEIQMAYSEYKNGKWTPKRVSPSDETGIITVSQSYDTSYRKYFPEKKEFLFTPLDIPQPDFSDLAQYVANGDVKGWYLAFLTDIENSLKQNGSLRINCYRYNATYDSYTKHGGFELDPCRGYPVQKNFNVYIYPLLFERSGWGNMLDDESPNASSANSLMFKGQKEILMQTPDLFRNVLSMQAGFFDRISYLLRLLFFQQNSAIFERGNIMTLGTFMPFFHQDNARTYYVTPEISDNDDFELFYSDLEKLFIQMIEYLKAIISGDTAKAQEIKASLPKFPAGKRVGLLYHFYNSYHPLVCFFMRKLFTKGIDGLMKRQTQLKGDVAYDPGGFSFLATYQPQPNVYTGSPVTYPNTVVDNTPGYPKEDVDFSLQSAYGLYNWELFYHAPLMIAIRLSENQQFEDADRWFKYIFNPTDTSAYPSPDKFWNTKPFFLNVRDASGNTKYDLQRIENIMMGINQHKADLEKDVADWRENPFQPHYIAQYRTVAYQKTTVMKYLDHLIRWGDNLFMQHTMESVTEATQLYVLAGQLLGKEPRVTPPAYTIPVDNYYQLEKDLDTFSNALVDIENLLPFHTYQGMDFSDPENPELPTLQTLYFCIPFNDKLFSYWNTISDRLFKIRHCLDINGVFSPLALFAPPIDPGLLVRATAAGLDLGSVLNDLNSPLPVYRFNVMIQKATELCNELKSLGTALLGALEKKDAEHMSLLRSSHEIKLLSAVLEVRKKQIDDAQTSIDNLNKQKELISLRRDYYQGLISNGLNTFEKSAMDLSNAAIVLDQAAIIIDFLGNSLSMIPDFNLGASGFGGSPHVAVKFGGEQLGMALRAMAGAVRGEAGILHSQSGIAASQATYQRRSDDWKFQLSLANKELEQIEKQILGAQIRHAIAEKEKDNQQLQIDNAKEESDFMHSKFTNEELYSYMISKISAVYFQSYKLAYDIAKRAEHCFRYELGLADSSYIKFGYWDSMKKGLLSGEQLMYNLKQLEMAYYEQNKREYELTKHISLAQLDPLALLQLKETGQCWVNLPEELFDLDYPGHYFRRIKSVSLSVPCVAGPYTTVGCTLTQVKNSIRVSGNSESDSKKYPRKAKNGVPADDPRFRDTIGITQSIVLSSGQNDNGMFELNYRDERYLPFEGTGVISMWHIQFPFTGTKNKAGTKPNLLLQQFDYNTISDVIIHVKFTAREGGDALKANASDYLVNKVNDLLVSKKDRGFMRLISLRHEYPTEWYTFLNKPASNGDQVCNIVVDQSRLPYFVSQNTVQVTNVKLLADFTAATPPLPALLVTAPNNNNKPYPFVVNPAYGTLLIADAASQAWGNNNLGTWKVTNPSANAVKFNNGNVNDIFVVVSYKVS